MDQECIFNRCPKFHELDLVEGNGKIMRVFEKGAGKWDKIATRLHFDGNKIAQIGTECQYNAFKACQSTFTEWLDGKEGLRQPTAWSTVITVLKEAGLGQLAGDLEEILLLEKNSASAQGIKSTTVTSSAQAPTATYTCTPTESLTQQTFPLLKRTMPGVSSESYEKLQTRLYSESVSLIDSFGRMINSFFQSLSSQDISIKKIVANLKAFGAFSSVYKGENQSLLRDELHRLDLDTADIDDIKSIVLDYCSFFNYRLISSLVVSLGTEDEKQLFEKYEAEFTEYAKRRIYECPSELGKSTNTNAILTIKLDSSYENCSLNQLKLLEADFCKILNVSNLNLCLVTSGCLQLTFQLPWFVQNEVFPLTQEQEEKLAALHVYSVTCGYYHFTVKNHDSFKLTGVTVTDRVLGHGSYATVLELQYKGLKCAGKKIHEVLLRQGASSYSVQRFEGKCQHVSHVCHPNIVQFLGFCYEPGVELPILVMEFLPTTLAASIENYGVMPTDINYSILHDVALGLYYLHSRPQPIIHRDLSSNNVLLTHDMKAKIADLGVARILDVSPLKASRMTQTPSTAAFMPPEVMIAEPTCNTGIDEFAYGVLMIHGLSGQWPAPQTGATRINDDGTLSVITEARRRQVFLTKIGSDHPLMELILRCIHNDPTKRAHAEELVQRLAEVSSLFPSSHSTRLEMQRKTELCERKAKELDLVCSTRKEQLQVQSEELTNMREIITSLTRLLQQKDDTIEKLSGQFNRVTSFLATNRQTLNASLTWKRCRDTPRESSIEQCTVIKGNVYLTAQGASIESDRYIVYCYNPSKDRWDILPPLPVQWYGLGQLNGKPVAVGGKRREAGPERSDKVYTFDESLHKWMKTVPSMPTGRGGPSVISLPSALVVAGGYAEGGYINTVEIFKLDTYQWYVTDPLPISCSNMAAYLIGEDTCYLLGGYTPAWRCINNAFSASFDDLFRNATAVTTTTDTASSSSSKYRKSGSAWKILPDTPNYQPTVATMLTDTLVAMGGWETQQGRVAKTEIHMYSPSTNSWVYVGDLPTPRAVTTAAVLSPNELLVIGGWDGNERVKTVYRGTLTITM